MVVFVPRDDLDTMTKDMERYFMPKSEGTLRLFPSGPLGYDRVSFQSGRNVREYEFEGAIHHDETIELRLGDRTKSFP